MVVDRGARVPGKNICSHFAFWRYLEVVHVLFVLLVSGRRARPRAPPVLLQVMCCFSSHTSQHDTDRTRFLSYVVDYNKSHDHLLNINKVRFFFHANYCFEGPELKPGKRGMRFSTLFSPVVRRKVVAAQSRGGAKSWRCFRAAQSRGRHSARRARLCAARKSYEYSPQDKPWLTEG